MEMTAAKIGRSMKKCEKHVRLPLTWPLPARRRFARRCGWLGHHLHRRAGREAHDAIHDHRVTGVQTAQHQHWSPIQDPTSTGRGCALFCGSTTQTK